MGKKKKQDKKKLEKKLEKKPENKLQDKKKQEKKPEKKLQDRKKQEKKQEKKSEKKLQDIKAEKKLSEMEQAYREEAQIISRDQESPEVQEAESDLLSLKDAEAAAIFRALGDEIRMQILDLLQERELCGSELLQSVDIVQSTLSHHMKTLTESGIVKWRKEGKKTYYSIQSEIWNKVISYIRKWS